MNNHEGNGIRYMQSYLVRLEVHIDSRDARKPVFGVCEQERCRPACASAQSVQRFCYSLIGKFNIQTYYMYMRNFDFLASLCS